MNHFCTSYLKSETQD